MHTTSDEARSLRGLRVAPAGHGDEIRERVTQILHRFNSKTILRERRSDRRYAYPYPVHLTPADDKGQPSGPTIVVLGKHLSEGGFDFYHHEPLPYRHVIVSLESRPQRWLGLLMVLSWCRFTQQGWYENGGRFLRAVDSPLPREVSPESLTA